MSDKVIETIHNMKFCTEMTCENWRQIPSHRRSLAKHAIVTKIFIVFYE